jgi:hypothetical protein
MRFMPQPLRDWGPGSCRPFMKCCGRNVLKRIGFAQARSAEGIPPLAFCESGALLPRPGKRSVRPANSS